MKERMKVDLEMRYRDSEINWLLSMSSFLDSRFKLSYVDDDDRENVLDEIKLQLIDLMVPESGNNCAT